MTAKRKTHFAVLGLLSWKPLSGYDVKRIVDVGLSHFWSENYGQIYPTLESLVEEGLVRKAVDPGSGKRKRHVYRITPEGRKTFRRWLQQPNDRPTIRNELLLKFFLSSKMPTKSSLRIIKEYRSQQQDVLREYQESESVLLAALKAGNYPDEIANIWADDETRRQSASQKARQCRVFLFTLRHGILAVGARVKWCDEVISFLSNES